MAKGLSEPGKGPEAKGDPLWSFVLTYAFMWAGMIGPSFNSDAIQGFSFSSALGLLCAFGIVVFLATAR
jgi:hypothetical protein